MEEKVSMVGQVSSKEYKPGKFRYGIKDADGVWFSTFHQSHFDLANEIKGRTGYARYIFEVGEYNGKPQYTLHSIEEVQEK
jgi:hypothetical protein